MNIPEHPIIDNVVFITGLRKNKNKNTFIHHSILNYNLLISNRNVDKNNDFYLIAYMNSDNEDILKEVLNEDEYNFICFHGYIVVAHIQRKKISNRRFIIKEFNCLDSLQHLHYLIKDMLIFYYHQTFKSHYLIDNIKKLEHEELFRELQEHIHHPVKVEKFLTKYGFEEYEQTY
jgi:hypothetical protein